MKIIDAHMHLPFSIDGMENKKKKLIDEMNKNGVDYAVVISDSYPLSAIGTLDECVHLFEKEENIFVVGGISPLVNYDEQLDKIEMFLEEKKIIGIKLFPGHEEFYLTDYRLTALYELARRFRVPVLYHSGWDNAHFSAPEVAFETAGLYPDINFICCHLNYPDVEGCLNKLIPRKNIYFDMSSLADDPRVSCGFETTLTAFIGKYPDRFLFGSDYEGCSQKVHIDFVRAIGISENAMEKVFHLNAEKIYKLL